MPVLTFPSAGSPCPGLNAPANHGYINRNGRDVNFGQLIAATFEGLGVSPEVAAIVISVGARTSKKFFQGTFDLENLAEHGTIEHDCSFSRQDFRVGNNNRFDPRLWAVVKRSWRGKTSISATDMGRAKVARINENKRNWNPKTQYDAKAAFFGAFEVGMVLAAMGRVTGPVKASYLNSLFEQERLPSHLCWQRSPFGDNLGTALGVGAESLAGNPGLVPGVPGEEFIQGYLKDSVTGNSGGGFFGGLEDFFPFPGNGIGKRDNMNILDDATRLLTHYGFNATNLQRFRRSLEQDSRRQ